MGGQRQYKGVEGIYRRVQGYVGIQSRYEGVEGIWVYVEEYRDISEDKDDTRG